MTTLTDSQIAAIVFNETRSLSGTAIAEARLNISHSIINALGSKHRFPMMASSTASPQPGEVATFAACVGAVASARANIAAGRDPTSGAEHFNFRKNALAGAFQGHILKTSSGPLDNSYPTAALPATGIYANTYA